ncbi:MAG TPA: hypothetical protein VH165_31675, partial [Kofleriaceae bacterium]|nr:hypothetical protein [Kofleriaceae bacterium]
SGVGLIKIGGAAGRMAVAPVAEAARMPDYAHHQSPAALSITNTTEYGARYAEAEIAALATELAFPIIPCNLCGSQDGLKRDAMTALLAQLEQTHPHVRAVMANALRNVRPTHLLDREVARAWAERAPEIRPAVVSAPRIKHAAAEPVIDGKLRLRVVD